jgi:hypothetical protein
LTIFFKDFNFVYSHRYGNSTLDNIKDGLTDFENKGGRLTNTTFDHKIQVYIMEFLQHQRPDIFNRLMRKDPLNRLIAPS